MTRTHSITEYFPQIFPHFSCNVHNVFVLSASVNENRQNRTQMFI